MTRWSRRWRPTVVHPAARRRGSARAFDGLRINQTVAEQVHRRGLGRIGEELLAAVANVVTFLVAFVIGLRVVYAVVFNMLDMGSVGPGFHRLLSERQAIVFSISLAFVIFGGLSTLWTRHVLTVTVASAAAFLFGMIMLAQAMYSADRGDPAIMWRFIKPQPLDYIGSAVTLARLRLGGTL
jgi:hypothetical protein